jgi:hypothetical protein
MPSTSSYLTGINARYGQGMAGRALKHGVMESFGWNIEGWGRNAVNKGFLGRHQWADEYAGITRNKYGAITKTAQHAGGLRGLGRAAFGTLMRSVGLLSTAYFAYEGYQQEGVWGAAKGIGEGVAWSTGIHYAMAATSGAAAAVMGVGAIAAAGAVGTYALGEAGRAHAKGLRQLEMGQQDQMQNAVHSAGAATMRQRSLTALNNTHLNGRMALGNEGFLMHRSFGG